MFDIRSTVVKMALSRKKTSFMYRKFQQYVESVLLLHVVKKLAVKDFLTMLEANRT